MRLRATRWNPICPDSYSGIGQLPSFRGRDLLWTRDLSRCSKGMGREPRMARINTDGQRSAGLRLDKPSCYGFSNPFTSKLARDYKTHRPFCYANGPASCALRRNLLEKIAGLRLARQAGRCFEKASASSLASDFYKTASAFA